MYMQTCSVEGCGRDHYGRGWCLAHYRRWKRHGDPMAGRPRGGTIVHPYEYRERTSDGYVLLRRPEHLNARKNGEILEHVWIMSTYLDRPLRSNEEVHHKNGIRNDNRIENLELWAKVHPKGQRVTDLVEFARSILAVYDREAAK